MADGIAAAKSSQPVNVEEDARHIFLGSYSEKLYYIQWQRHLSKFPTEEVSIVSS